MSNALAIATVTATLRSILGDAATAAVADAQVTYLRPDSAAMPIPAVNIFLFQATPSPAWRNSDLPTRSADGSPLRRPRTALDLHYLVTFHGQDADLVPQILLGAVALKLHAQPVLPRDVIAQVAATEKGTGAYGLFLQGSDLADQIESVRVTPSLLTLEELSKLWAVFPEANYVLSSVYVASVVLIETSDVPPGSAPPVLRASVTALPSRAASIDSIAPGPVELSPSPPTPITLVGTGLDPSDLVSFTTPGVVAPIAGTVLAGGPTQLQVALPDGLRPGVNTVTLIQMAAIAEGSSPPGPPLPVSQSNVAAFLLRPSVVGLGHGSPAGQIVATVSPKVGARQDVALLLNPAAGASGPAFAIPADHRSADSDTLTFATSGPLGRLLPVGDYLARLRVDGAESRMQIGGSGQFIGPIVTIS